MRSALLVLSSFIAIASASAEWQGRIDGDVWSLPSSATSSRWLVIHDRDAARAEGVYHVEVLERATGAPLWQVNHLAPHMAVTERALRASIVEPLRRGAVYPEAFDEAFAKWKEENAQRSAPVCTSTVIECLK